MSDLARQHKMLRLLKDVDINKYLSEKGLNFCGIIGALELEAVEELPKIWYNEDREFSLAETTNALNDFFLTYFSQIGKKGQAHPVKAKKK